MNRRNFIKLISAGVIGHELDIDRLLWVPGAKKIFIPESPKIYSMYDMYLHRQVDSLGNFRGRWFFKMGDYADFTKYRDNLNEARNMVKEILRPENNMTRLHLFPLIDTGFEIDTKLCTTCEKKNDIPR